MKITSVDIFLLRHVGEEFSPFPFRPAVCRVNTDEGICGYGEAGISVGTGENGVAYMLKDLAQLILGKDPMNNEVIWEDIHNVLRGHLSGGGVTVYSAMSALDTAMMDIKGKKLGFPSTCCWAANTAISSSAISPSAIWVIWMITASRLPQSSWLIPAPRSRRMDILLSSSMPWPLMSRQSPCPGK